MRFIDLSHTVVDGMTNYPGLPGPVICDFLSREASRGRYAPGVEFQIGKIEMVANTGTYVDSPFHRYADGKDLSELSFDALAHLDAVVVQAAGRARGIGPEAFEGHEVTGRAVLVGIDALNIDDLEDSARPVHSTLLGAGIPIVEHLCNLGPLPDRGFRFSAVPPKVAGFGTWPVRAFAAF